MENTKYDHIIVIFDIDGTLTHVPGGKCINGCKCLWSQGWDKFKETFLEQKKLEIMYLKAFINLLQKSKCHLRICTNNYQNTVEDFFNYFGLNDIKGRFRNNMQNKQEYVSSFIDSEKVVYYFEDDPKYFKNLDDEIEVINCQKRWLGSQLYTLIENIRYDEDIVDDLQNLYKFLLMFCEDEKGILKAFISCPLRTDI